MVGTWPTLLNPLSFFTSESGIGIDEKDTVTVFLINFAAFKPWG